MNADSTIDQIVTQSFFSSAMSAFWIIFFSEFGDRTFLTTMVFSSTMDQSNKQTVLQKLLNRETLVLLLATNAAATLLALISSGLGSLSTQLADPSINQYIHIIASLACVLFGCHMIYEAATETETETVSSNDQAAKKSPSQANNQSIDQSTKQSKQHSLTFLFVQSFTAAVLTESFDHGQMSFFMLSTNQTVNHTGVLVGGILAHILCTTVAAIGGSWIAAFNQSTNQANARRIQRYIQYAAGTVFVGMAVGQMLSAD